MANSEEMRREYRELVSALENGDVGRAGAATKEQMISSRDRILEAIVEGKLSSIQVI
jgi:DNA-binding GntR family transcriptional regulator